MPQLPINSSSPSQHQLLAISRQLKLLKELGKDMSYTPPVTRIEAKRIMKALSIKIGEAKKKHR